MSKAAVEALRENPSWSRMPRHGLRCALWAFYYSDEPPTRDDIAAALIAAQHQHPRPVESYSWP
jgi:hypothetical protein